MKITILTIFPDFFEKFLDTSIIKRAISNNIVEIKIVNIRDFSNDKNKRIDDTPFGGGAGLVMRAQPIVDSINSTRSDKSHVIYLSPRGKRYNQDKAKEYSKLEELIILCGHYEGVDERVLDYVNEEVSVGDYILTGGEIPAMIVSESLIRLLDGSISKESLENETFENNLLEYPQYTIPRDYKGKKVPDILLSGNHEAIEKWRHKQSLKLTKNNRPDLFSNYKVTKKDLKLLEELENDIEAKWEKDAIENSLK